MKNAATTGLVPRRDRAEWTTLRRRKGHLEKVAHRAASLPIDEAGAPVAGAYEAALREACAGIRGRVSLALPAAQALMRVLDLPAVDPDELAAMVELQVDKFSPFPVDQLVVSYERFGVSEGRSRVLAAAVRRATVEEAAATAAAAGVSVARLDLDLLGWWHLLYLAEAFADPGRACHVLVGGDAALCLVTQDGVPVLCRTLSEDASGTPLGDLLDEVRFTLTALESEWGSAERTEVVLWRSAERETAGGEPADFPLPLSFRRLDKLPPLSEGIALRSITAGPGRLNLAPAEWAEQRRTRRVTRGFWTATIAFLALWGLGVLGFWGALRVQRARTEAMRRQVSELEKPAEAARLLRERMKSLEEYADRTQSALEILREVSTRMPAGIDLSNFAYKKGRTVSLRGESASANTIYDFVGALQQCALFSEVKAEGITTRPTAGKTVSEFKIIATLAGGAP